MFSSPGGSPFQTSLLNVSSRRSLHSTSITTPSLANRSRRAGQAIKETKNHVVKAINSPVPVQVQESLRGDLTSVSVRLDESGWAWLVCGQSRRVLLWRYGPQESSARCFQLSLPFHSKEWNADSITVCGQISASRVGILAVSSDGHLHYWDNALREQSAPSANGTVDVGSGHVIVSRPVLQGNGAAVFTSGGSLFLVQLPLASQSSLHVRALHSSLGLLSGLGRRMTSLFFRSSAPEEHTVGHSVAVRDTQNGVCHLFALVRSSLLLLQKWVIEETREQMMYELSLEPVIGASVTEKDWLKGSLSVWAVDVAISQDHVVVLFAVGAGGSTVAEFGLALFDAHCDSAPSNPDSIIRLNHKISHQSGGEDSLYSLSLHCSPSSPSATVHDKNTLLLSLMATDSVSTDVVHFPSSTVVLGKGLFDGDVVLFTTTHGVISVHLTSPVAHLPSSSSHHPPSHTSVTAPLVVTSALPTSSRAPPPELVAEAVEKLKNAFLEYLDGNLNEATESAQQLFSPEPYGGGGGGGLTHCDSLGDMAVKELSELVLNDPPSQDSRWGEARESLTGGSVIILYQLESKQTAHLRVVQFVGDCGLLNKLSCVTVRGQPMRTTHLLCEHAEKIAAAIALRKAHNQMVDQAMKMCMAQRLQFLPRPGLSHQDLFYTELVQLDSLFPSLLSFLQSRLPSLGHPKERLQLVVGLCGPVEAMLREVVQYRQGRSSLYSPSLPPDPSSLPPFSPWTASTGSSGMRACLSQLLELAYETAVQDADTQQDAVEVWGVAVGMCDVLLGGYLDQIHSMEPNPALSTELAQLQKQFESARKIFLSPLFEHGQYDQSIALAERYHDFHLLVRLCESTDDRERLKSYVARFSEEGFAEFLFKRHLDQEKIQELMSYSEDFPKQLSKFLEPHEHLSWLHHLATQDYAMAHQTLQRLSQKEQQFVGRKKVQCKSEVVPNRAHHPQTQLSMSKLALLASEPENGNGKMEELNRELSIIEYQLNIPDAVLEALGVDVDTMPPLTPAEIVQLYVGEKNERADENDFLHALELLQIAYEDRKSEAFVELKTYIWSQAALRNNWSQMSTDNPLDQLPHTLLFRVIKAAYHIEFNLEHVLPAVEDLLSSPSLLEAGVAQSTQFKFLVSAGFEQLQRLQSSGAV